MTDLKKWMTTALLWLLLLSATAQERTDTTYTFRFMPQKDMFYVPWNSNEMELARLLECIESNKTDILGGKLPLFVDGYCNSLGSESENLATAKLRANRVKSELIVRAGIKEESFVTRNHSDSGDYVTVRITTTHSAQAQAPSTPPEGGAMVASDITPDEAYINNKVENTSVEQDPATETQSLPSGEVGGARAQAWTRSLSLRANLLRWATLTPDLGMEWRIHPSWGILVNGSWTSWSWNDKDRRYALWEVAPEVRYYIGKEKRGYLGAMFKTGEFHYKLSDTGKQGDLMGGGITGGYLLRLNDALSLDFSLALGYLNADYEKYEVIDGVRVRRGNDTKNWWGPVNAGVTLVWTLF